jgi:Cu(I)/Ag(I) efflux system membrane fusion protein
MTIWAAVAAGAASLAACGDGNEAAVGDQARTGQVDQDAGAAGEQSGEVHSASGDITEVAGDGVTISHGPVESIAWPAMTMTFQAGSPEMLQGLNVGDPVDFQFQQAGEQNVLTSISKAQQ